MTTRRRPLSIAALAAPIAVLLGAGEGVAQNRWAEHYQARVAAFKRENAGLSADAKSIVLIGDSLTEGWKYNRRIARFLTPIKDRVLNRGIVADGVGIGPRGVANRLPSSLLETRATHAFLMIGINDLAPSGSNVDAVAGVLDRLVARMREQRPAVALTLLTLTPVNKGYRSRNAMIRRFNDRVRATARRHGAGLLDAHALLVDDNGELPADMASDGLHFNDSGYRILAKAILGALSIADAEPDAEPDTVEPGARVQVTAERLNVRKTPRGERLLTIPRGLRLTVLEARDGWQRVAFTQDGQRREGWVSAKWTRPVDAESPADARPEAGAADDADRGSGEDAPANGERSGDSATGAREPARPMLEVTAAALNFRATPGGRKLAVLPKGKRLLRLERRDGWVRVRVDEREGWVAERFTKSVTVTSPGAAGAINESDRAGPSSNRP